MISRIHLALKYEALGRDARKAVWEFFLGQAGTKMGDPDCEDGLGLPVDCIVFFGGLPVMNDDDDWAGGAPD
jgi:hypothetical protein